MTSLAASSTATCSAESFQPTAPRLSRSCVYRGQFAELETADLARLVCDPIEYYDKDWPAYRLAAGVPEQEALARFVVERDARFRNEARVAIYCFDEAGIGSGINATKSSWRPIAARRRSQPGSPSGCPSCAPSGDP